MDESKKSNIYLKLKNKLGNQILEELNFND